MMNQAKYRRISLIAITAMTALLLLVFSAIWNLLLATSAENEGWVVVLLILLFAAGVIQFLAAFRLSDPRWVSEIRIKAYESGKSEVHSQVEEQRKLEAQAAAETHADQVLRECGEILSGLQNLRSRDKYLEKLLSQLSARLEVVQGIIYILDPSNGLYHSRAGYALSSDKPEPVKAGEGLTGLVVETGETNIVYDVPEDYTGVVSGLGKGRSAYLVILPVMDVKNCVAIVELGLFRKPTGFVLDVLHQVCAELGTRLSKFENRKQA